MSSFHIDGRIDVKMEVEFAARLGEFILAQGIEDKQFQAFAHQLVNMVDSTDEDTPFQVGSIAKPKESKESVWSEKPKAMHEKVFANRAKKIRWGHTD